MSYWSRQLPISPQVRVGHHTSPRKHPCYLRGAVRDGMATAGGGAIRGSNPALAARTAWHTARAAMRRIRRWAALLVVLALAVVPAACGGGGTRESNGRVEVRFWHAMSGANGVAIQKMVDGFNSSQSTYHVTATYQGGYPDLLKKLVSSFGTSSMPAMIQLDDIETQFMVDSDATVPPQTFIDR